ncbi:DUF6053 domain-containing protein [Lysobacter enzymogenes]|uniref:DUF6053 domain-containing protein n=1 Tax=Lysobacter enzymogenes TaxID=69 RepID=UPI003D18AD48
MARRGAGGRGNFGSGGAAGLRRGGAGGEQDEQQRQQETTHARTPRWAGWKTNRSGVKAGAEASRRQRACRSSHRQDGAYRCAAIGTESIGPEGPPTKRLRQQALGLKALPRCGGIVGGAGALSASAGSASRGSRRALRAGRGRRRRYRCGRP